MQSCIWQHLRAFFFHAGFNLICCQGIEEAKHSMELYSVSYRQRDGQMNLWPELWSMIIGYCIKQRTAVILEFYLCSMTGEMLLYTLAMFLNFKTQLEETLIKWHVLNSWPQQELPGHNTNIFLENVKWGPKLSAAWLPVFLSNCLSVSLFFAPNPPLWIDRWTERHQIE